MAPPSSLVSKLKVQLKLSISRLRMTQQKDSALAKQQWRAMAQLIESGKFESARIRTENIIRSDINTELHEVLELYCELLLARSQLLDPPPSVSLGAKSGKPEDLVDPGLEEAVRSLIYAAPRTEIKELHMVRNLLVEKFGKEFALSAMEGQGVAERVLNKLKTDTPEQKVVDGYLREICRTYSVRFPGDPDPQSADEEDDDDDDAEGKDGGVKERTVEAPLEAESLSKATPPSGIGPQSPIRIAPPSPSSNNIAPGVKVPGQTGELKPNSKMKKAAVKSDRDDGPGGKIPDVDELAKRFAALKR